MKRRNVSLWLVGVLLLVGLWVDTPFAREKPSVPEEYQKYFAHYVDQRSYMEKILNSIGLTNQDIGRSFALIAGVSYYPNLPAHEQTLKPATEDLRKLEDYLKHIEFFDEIVVLKNQDMNYENLKFFLQSYFFERLKRFPKSRFLFAYSGHGITEGENGYLLLSSAQDFSDRQNCINLKVVRVLLDEVVDSGYHVLAMINACYSGVFLRRSFGDRHFFPKHSGAHAITAGGTRELTWHYPEIGTGSVFFEKFFTGLDGRADILPKNPDDTSGDGIVTVDELFAYLKREVQISTDQKQNPQSGDISRDGSLGGIFFLNRSRPVIIQEVIGRSPKEIRETFGPTPIPTSVPTATPQPPTPTPTATPEPIFRLNDVVIRVIGGKVIHPVDGIYEIKVGEIVIITVDVTKPQNHELRFTWTAGHGIVSSENRGTTIYKATKIESDYVLIRIVDKNTGEKLEKPINITIVP